MKNKILNPSSPMDSTVFVRQAQHSLNSQGIFYCRVKILPNSPKNEIVELMEGDEPTLKIRIATLPEKGKANKMLCAFLAKICDCSCEIISGHTSPIKLVKLYQ